MVINLMGFGHKIYFFPDSSSLFAIKISMFEFNKKPKEIWIGKLVIFMPNHEFSSSLALKVGRRRESYNNSNKHIINIQFGEILFRWHDEVEKNSQHHYQEGKYSPLEKDENFALASHLSVVRSNAFRWKILLHLIKDFASRIIESICCLFVHTFMVTLCAFLCTEQRRKIKNLISTWRMSATVFLCQGWL